MTLRVYMLNTRMRRIKIINKRILQKIRSHLRDIIDDLKKYGEWKMDLTMKPRFISSADAN